MGKGAGGDEGRARTGAEGNDASSIHQQGKRVRGTRADTGGGRIEGYAQRRVAFLNHAPRAQLATAAEAPGEHLARLSARQRVRATAHNLNDGAHARHGARQRDGTDATGGEGRQAERTAAPRAPRHHLPTEGERRRVALACGDLLDRRAYQRRHQRGCIPGRRVSEAKCAVGVAAARMHGCVPVQQQRVLAAECDAGDVTYSLDEAWLSQRHALRHRLAALAIVVGAEEEGVPVHRHSCADGPTGRHIAYTALGLQGLEPLRCAQQIGGAHAALASVVGAHGVDGATFGAP